MKEIILKDIENLFSLDSIDGKEFRIPIGETTIIEGVSGRGKTSFINLLLGLAKYSKGDIIDNSDSYSVVFQEDRLFEQLSAVENVKITNKGLSKEYIEEELKKLLPKEYIRKPVSVYSRGMKRRVAIVRAVLKESDILVMDEPFAGLDEETRNKAADYIKENLNGRTFIIAVHDKEEAHYFKVNKIITL